MKVTCARLNAYSIACTVKYIQNQMNRDLSGQWKCTTLLIDAPSTMCNHVSNGNWIWYARIVSLNWINYWLYWKLLHIGRFPIGRFFLLFINFLVFAFVYHSECILMNRCDSIQTDVQFTLTKTKKSPFIIQMSLMYFVFGCLVSCLIIIIGAMSVSASAETHRWNHCWLFTVVRSIGWDAVFKIVFPKFQNIKKSIQGFFFVN